MFVEEQNQNNVQYYQKMLKAAGSLSNLFSESPQPYLGYRLVENLFCKSFEAENLSRFDCSVDASKESVGIGVKTFLYKNGKSFEKIAEFNKELDLFRGLNPDNMVKKISELRNQRLEFTRRNYRISDILYHCVVRNTGKIIVYETPMHSINLNRIRSIDSKRNTLSFKDNLNEYRFNIAKSTLFRQFIAQDFALDFNVEIISDPFKALEKLLDISAEELVFVPIREQPHVFLPLYSGRSGTKNVPEKSGLNQWNASGRPRDPNEIYIPIPAWIHRDYPDFFPERDTTFNLRLPNGDILNAKVCQDNAKALMTNPNAAMGRWLLRDVLGLQEREPLTYEMLEAIGLDTVVIYKENEENFEIEFSRIGTYESFKGELTATEND